MIIIITYGSKKCLTPTIAKKMYIGSHFKNCFTWAKSKTTEDKIYILSAKYGLLKPDTLILPYDLKMGDKGSVTSDVIKKQADLFGILNEKIISTAGSEYRKVLSSVFNDVHYPFNGLSMGYMAQAMKRDLR